MDLSRIGLILLIIAAGFIILKIMQTKEKLNNTSQLINQSLSDSSNINRSYINHTTNPTNLSYKDLDILLDNCTYNNSTNSNNYYLNNNKVDTKCELNPYFNDLQYHNDYRDTITSFYNIAPKQKQFFNLANVPVEFSDVDKKDVKPIIRDFIKEVNNNVASSVPEYRTNNSGWDEAIPNPRIESGWEKQMKALGVAPNLYPEPASNESISLICIEHIEKYQSEYEIKYVCYLVVQKNNVKDQMVLRVSFVLNKSDLNEDRDFFNDLNNIYDKDQNKGPNVVIEEIYILGFLTRFGENKDRPYKKDFYSFTRLENSEILDQRVILDELNEKYKQRTIEMNNFNASLDLEGRNFHSSLPELSDFDGIKQTRTIYDDINRDPHGF